MGTQSLVLEQKKSKVVSPPVNPSFTTWVEVKTAISEGSNGYPKSCFGAKKIKSSVSPC